MKDMVIMGCGNRMTPLMKAFQASLVVHSPAWTGRSTAQFIPQFEAKGADHIFLAKVAKTEPN